VSLSIETRSANMFVDSQHPREIRIATMGAGLALTVLGFANGVACADDTFAPVSPDPGALTTPSTVTPSAADPSITTPAAVAPTTSMPGTTTPPSNGALLPTLLVDAGTLLGQLGNALGTSTSTAAIPGT
jgi:hypothetical protein